MVPRLENSGLVDLGMEMPRLYENQSWDRVFKTVNPIVSFWGVQGTSVIDMGICLHRLYQLRDLRRLFPLQPKCIFSGTTFVFRNPRCPAQGPTEQTAVSECCRMNFTYFTTPLQCALSQAPALLPWLLLMPPATLLTYNVSHFTEAVCQKLPASRKLG